MSEEAQVLTHMIQMTGAKPPNDYFLIECDPPPPGKSVSVVVLTLHHITFGLVGGWYCTGAVCTALYVNISILYAIL